MCDLLNEEVGWIGKFVACLIVYVNGESNAQREPHGRLPRLLMDISMSNDVPVRCESVLNSIESVPASAKFVVPPFVDPASFSLAFRTDHWATATPEVVLTAGIILKPI